MSIGGLGATWLQALLTGISTIRAGKSTVRACQDF